MPILAGLISVISYAAVSYQTEFDMYHVYGMQPHWAGLCRFKRDIPRSVAETTVLTCAKDTVSRSSTALLAQFPCEDDKVPRLTSAEKHA